MEHKRMTKPTEPWEGQAIQEWKLIMGEVEPPAGYLRVIKELKTAFEDKVLAAQKAEFEDIRKEFTNEMLYQKEEALEKQKAELRENIGPLRQWLNEDRITDPKKMVSNENLESWLLKLLK